MIERCTSQVRTYVCVCVRRGASCVAGGRRAVYAFTCSAVGVGIHIIHTICAASRSFTEVCDVHMKENRKVQRIPPNAYEFSNEIILLIGYKYP